MMYLKQYKTSSDNSILKYIIHNMLVVLSLSVVISCGDHSSTSNTTTPTTTTSPNTVTLTTSKTSVVTDNTDSATITATVLQNYAPVEGITVSFSPNGGQISATSATTDSNGEAQINFTSGPGVINQTVLITASVPGIGSQSIPIQITGTSLTMSAGTSSLAIAASTTVTVTATDANSVPIYDAAVNYSISPTSTGAITISSATGLTDVNGQHQIIITGLSGGTVNLVCTGLGTTATLQITIGAPVATFGITDPTIDPASLAIGSNLTVTVNAPIATTVDFITSIGDWNGTGNKMVSISGGPGPISASLGTSEAGLATVTVRDQNDITLTDTINVAMFAPAISATQLNLQASATNIAPSTGGTTNSLTVEATVLNVLDQVVGNAAVLYEIINPTGYGEYISPVITYTDSTGKASATFYSGSDSSPTSGVDVRATVFGTTISGQVNIIIGGSAGSVVLGMATEIKDAASATAYEFPISVLIADTNGNPVPGAVVSLSLRPTHYTIGSWWNSVGTTPEVCVPEGGGYQCVFEAEDLNLNLILDPPPGTPGVGEDAPPGGYDLDLNPGHGDGALTPANSAAGNIPSSVTTGTDGIGTFNITYLKTYAWWTKVKLKATVLVFGSETSAELNFWLPIKEGETGLPASPYYKPDINPLPLYVFDPSIPGYIPYTDPY